jgi:hypothetical protein
VSDEFLEPDEAARRFDEDPATVAFPLATFWTYFGLSKADVLKELRAGRLVAMGEPLAGGRGYGPIVVSGQAVLDWLRNPRTPKRHKRVWWSRHEARHPPRSRPH